VVKLGLLTHCHQHRLVHHWLWQSSE
jgi:hypothetical protein